MYRGRFQLGQDVPLYLQTKTAAGAASLPDDAPTLDIWTSSAKVKTVKMPVIDRYAATGVFLFPLFLDVTFATGLYKAEYRWNISTFNGIEEDTFEILPGGSGDGTVLAMYMYERPHAKFLLQQLSSGNLAVGRNPYL